MKIKVRAILWGLGGFVLMALFYIIVMMLTMQSVELIWQTYLSQWLLFTILMLGFGLQIGLWQYLKSLHLEHAGSVASASGVASGSSMVACCAHHLAEILPILGISGAATFLSAYQQSFLLLGVGINLLGIAYMLNKLNHFKGIRKQIVKNCNN